MELEKWSIFSLLDKEFTEKVKTVCVYGSAGNEALLVTKNDDVFAIGTNTSGCLGLGDQDSCIIPRKVEHLSQRKVKGFAFGNGPHVLACSEAGELFAWGHNGYCQLGNGTTCQSLIPKLVLTSLESKMVVKVASGAYHSVALTSDGEVYAWGQNTGGQVGSASTTNQSTPRRVTFGGSVFVTDIACCQTSTLAVSDSGEVYFWGTGNNISQLAPTKIGALLNTVITKISCGHSHILALSDSGVLYTWGMNSSGQLGIGNRVNQVAPTRIDQEIGRFIDIAASHYCHVSAAMTQDSKVYMWGLCKGQVIPQPMLTEFSSLYDVFAFWAAPSVTYEPLCLEICPRSALVRDIGLAFDDQETADVTFIVEGRPIYVHKSLLKIRCHYFRRMFQDHWKENQEIPVKEYSYSVFRAFLEYIYTDSVNVSPEDAIALMELANAYLEMPLKQCCESIIQHGITTHNAAMLYAVAVKYDAPVLEEYCFRFALNHMTEVTQTEAFMALDEMSVKNFIQRAALQGAFKH